MSPQSVRGNATVCLSRDKGGANGNEFFVGSQYSNNSLLAWLSSPAPIIPNLRVSQWSI